MKASLALDEGKEVGDERSVVSLREIENCDERVKSYPKRCRDPLGIFVPKGIVSEVRGSRPI